MASVNAVPRWADVPAEIAFAYFRHGMGESFKDPKFLDHVKAARDTGRLVGAYHAAQPDADPLDDAAAFLDSRRHELDLPPALDLEVMNNMPAMAVLNWARGWLQTVEEQGDGVIPLLYTGPAFWDGLWNAVKLQPGLDWGRWPLWLSQYGVGKPMLLKPWAHVTLWQYAANTIAQLADGTHVYGAPARVAVANGTGRLLAKPGLVPGMDGEVDRNVLLV